MRNGNARTVAASLAMVTILSWSAPASAQRAELSFNIGYTASEGISLENRPLLGAVYDTLGVDSGAAVTLTFGYLFTEQAGVEFLWARQNSQLQADGPAGVRAISDLSVHSYHFNFVYNVGASDARMRPFVFGGLGATQYSFGNNLLPGATGDIEGETRFSTNWGGGVKFYFTPNVGARVGVRWIPTYIKSDPAGVWCDPFYGCWQLVDNDYSNQFETTGGITVRFD